MKTLPVTTPQTLYIYRLAHHLFLCRIGSFESFASTRQQARRIAAAYQCDKLVWI